MNTVGPATGMEEATKQRAESLFEDHRQAILKRTDRLFAGLMVVQWLAGLLAACWISPRAWDGVTSHVHPHVWAALFLGGVIILYPLYLALTRPGLAMTRHTIAIAQMLTSALLIHLTGGRIETHFHVFGSLAFLAFYRDWSVLMTASAVVAADHFLRGVWWPVSVYGVQAAAWWRWLEHAGWVVFEDIFLIASCLQGVREMREIAWRQASVESLHQGVEQMVLERTAALRASEERFRSLNASAPVGIFQTDAEGRAIYCNRQWTAIAGLSLEESLGDGWVRAVHPEDRDRVVVAWVATVREGAEHASEFRIKTPAGQVRWINVQAHPTRLENGSITGYVGTVEDITERRQLEVQLRQAQKMEAVGRLAGGIAHDFNNLLTVILGNGGLLLAGPGKDGPAQRKIEEIVKAGERAAGLTRQLLAFSRKQVLQPKVLNLNSVVGEMEKMLRPLIGEDIQLTTFLEKEPGQAKADPGQIEQVILNLAVNARDAMPNGGKLTLETANVDLSEAYAAEHPGAHAGRYVMLAVSDTGAGMDAQTQSHIFEPFFTTKGPGRGTGLGLATVYGVVKQSDGYISVYSELGHGTTFKVYLPRVDEEEESAPAPASAASMPRGGETILLVEDEDGVRGLARAILEDLGYGVLEAPSPDAALRLIDRHSGPLHLVLTDVVMPGMNGRELVSRVACIRPDARVLYMSGYTDDAIVHHGVLKPGTAFLNKPFSPRDLARKVREVLDDPRATPAAQAA
jgi:PAS domain S-box-containing protein